MATPNSSSEQVRYDILIEAKQAIQNLRTIMKTTEDNTTKMQLFSVLVMDSAKKWGMAWQQALGVYRQLNQELSRQKKGTLFGQTGGQDLFGQTSQYLQSLQDAGRLQDKVGQSAKKMGDEIEHSSKRAVRGLDVVRIAAGALVAMFIFNVINAIQTTFDKAIELARQYEDTLYRLRNVEQSLSLSGIEISMKGLKQGITDIQKLLPIFSKEDVSQLVGTLAISTKQLGLNEKQILDLAKAIGILNIRSEKQEDLSTTAQHVLSSLLTGNAKGITALGIAFTENVMRAKAMELGFLEADEALSNLTENEKGITKLNIVLESTGGELANVGEYLDSNSAKLQENKASWNDLLTTIGQIILPFIPAVTSFFKLINDGFNGLKVLVIEATTYLGTFAAVMIAIFTGQISSIEQFTEFVDNAVNKFRKKMVNELFSEVPENAPEWFKEGWGDLIDEEAETATSAIEQFGEAVDEFDSSGFEQEIEDIIEATRRAREDLNAALNEKLADLGVEYSRKAADAQLDYARKVEDINRDIERDIANLKEKHRQEDKRSEEKYQLALWELRQRFLLNLEDALHARDARQVIRLQKEYKIDKEALRRKHELENREREESQRAEVESLEEQRQRRLEDAKIEYEQKLADLNTAMQREAQDLQKWYEREQADIELAQQRKLETLLKGWIDEQKITQENAAAVYEILRSYFGPGGMTDQLYQYMMQSLLANTVGAINQATAAAAGSLNALYGLANNVNPFQGNYALPPSDQGSVGSRTLSDQGFAEGGTLLATRPTRALFGEGGPELVNFTPLNRVGKNINKIFGDRSGGGVNGQIRVLVDLSPDLEGRIVEQSMDGVAEVISKVGRMK